MELPSRIRYARPELAEERLGQRRREWSGSARLWRAQAGWLYGLRGQAGWDHVAERLRVVQASGADTVVESRSLSKGSWTVKPFAAHWFGDWMVEADLPLRREWELRKDSTSMGWSERELVALELWPQAALRRYWSLLGARPFAELFSQVGLRFVQQEGGEAGAREADYANWRAGGSVGFRFLGGVDGAGRPRPRGEFRMRVMQHLDRSWYTSFGGGNILLVIAW
jgi:hypothetical protein